MLRSSAAQRAARHLPRHRPRHRTGPPRDAIIGDCHGDARSSHRRHRRRRSPTSLTARSRSSRASGRHRRQSRPARAAARCERDRSDGRRGAGCANTSASTAPASASRSSTRALRPGTTTSAPTASCTSPTSSTSVRCRTTTTGTARTSPASSRATGTTPAAPAAASRPVPTCRAQGPRRRRRRTHQRCHRRDRLRDANTRAASTSGCINLSVAAGVYESYNTDPLALAAKRAVDAGIVVVTAAGNLGRDAAGSRQYGGIAAPGNAPWVLTVGASTTRAPSIGPTTRRGVQLARADAASTARSKPDLVAPGVGIESLADAAQHALSSHARRRACWGTVGHGRRQPYLRLSGTSMAAPVVDGNDRADAPGEPELTPQSVKAILQSTAETQQPNADQFTQGAGS